jgi:outer membrane protein TolC
MQTDCLGAARMAPRRRRARLFALAASLASVVPSGTGAASPVTLEDTVALAEQQTLFFSLPFFRRNASGIGRARTELEQAHIERQAGARDTETAVRALWQRLQSLRRRVDRLQAIVGPSLEDNQKLSLKALQAGEIGLVQFLLVRRQVLDGQRDLLEARTEQRLTRIALETAAGWPELLPPLDEGPEKPGKQ